MAFRTADENLKNNISPLLTTEEKLDFTDEDNLNRETGLDQGVEPAVSTAVEPESEIVSNPLGTIKLDSIDVKENYASENPDVDISKPIPNPLHEFASYTYGLSLALMTAEEYNNLIKNGFNANYTPNRVLIASAGRHNNEVGTDREFIRAPYFEDDFYFDGFDLETVIGLNAQSRNSNAVHYNFTLIEPYGFTLIDRIVSLTDDLGVANYLDMPYMLQIDFFGIDDTGKITGLIPDTTKRVPIRLNKMDVGITQKGAEYKIEGVPYCHSAYDLSTVTTPANFEVKAKTVAEFFSSNTPSSETKTEETERQTTPDGQFFNTNNVPSSLLGTQSKIDFGLINSYGTALNNWQKAAADAGKIGKKDVYLFKFLDDDIANSLFTDQAISSPKDTGMSQIGSVKNSIYKSNTGQNTSDYDANFRIFQVNAGTYIDRVIAWVIRNSKWMTNQIVIPDGKDAKTYLEQQAKLKNQTFYWFKITTSIKLLEFDQTRKIWSREITYNIQKYEIKNAKSDQVGQAQVKNPVKAYNYIYTGKNDDILDIDIKFNALYYNALTIYKTHLSSVVRPADIKETKDKNNPSNYKGQNQDPNAIMPMVMKPTTYNSGSTNSSGSTTAEQLAKADIEESLMTMAQADMLNIELDIIGDPTFIKQDEIFWTPAIASEYANEDPRLTYDGSLKMDKGEVYVSLIFRTPTDRDDETGLMKFDSKYQRSLFSGIYRVLTVTNKFRSGQFTQTLSLVRVPKQLNFDYADNKKSTSNERESTVPGEQAIVEDYNLSPYNIPQTTTGNLAQAVDEGPAAQNRDLSPLEPALEGPDQQALRGVNETATTEPMTDQNEPAPFNPFRGVPSGADTPSQQGSFGQ